MADRDSIAELLARRAHPENVMPWVEPKEFGHPAEMYQWARSAGLPKDYAREQVREEMYSTPGPWGWVDEEHASEKAGY